MSVLYYRCTIEQGASFIRVHGWRDNYYKEDRTWRFPLCKIVYYG